MPTFVYLIPTLILFGLGIVPGLIVTVIFAIPAPIRLTHLGITSVPQAADRGRRGLRRHPAPAAVEGRAALRRCRTIMAGLTQCIMLSLSMVVIAALVGADGLGKPVVRALNTVNIAAGLRGRASPSSSSPSSSTASAAPAKPAGGDGDERRRRFQGRRHRLRRRDRRSALTLIDQGATARRDPGADRRGARLRRRQPRRQRGRDLAC